MLIKLPSKSDSWISYEQPLEGYENDKAQVAHPSLHDFVHTVHMLRHSLKHWRRDGEMDAWLGGWTDRWMDGLIDRAAATCTFDPACPTC